MVGARGFLLPGDLEGFFSARHRLANFAGWPIADAALFLRYLRRACDRLAQSKKFRSGFVLEVLTHGRAAVPLIRLNQECSTSFSA